MQAGKADADTLWNCNEEQGTVSSCGTAHQFAFKGQLVVSWRKWPAEPSPSSPSAGDPAECRELLS